MLGQVYVVSSLNTFVDVSAFFIDCEGIDHAIDFIGWRR